MSTIRLAGDPLWQCLCPAWASATPLRPARVLATLKHRTPPFLKEPSAQRRGVRQDRLSAASRQYDLVYNPLQKDDRGRAYSDPPRRVKERREPRPKEEIDVTRESTSALYHLLHTTAIDGRTEQCKKVAEALVRDRGERPNLQMYNALVLSNLSHDEGAAVRVTELLDDMNADGLDPDQGTCHAVLKVLAVHVDHLLRTDILDYMSQRWYALSSDGAHDVAAGLFREGLFEQALRRLEMMRQQDIDVQGWLLDIAIYTLCTANEIPEAYRLLRQRVDSGNGDQVSRSLWTFFLDKASAARHTAGTTLVWTTQVRQDYINPSSGICLDVLSTASRAGDAVIATEVFTHLSKRGTAFQPIHYDLLISAYLSMTPPDLKRALSILTIMPLEKLDPSTMETRALFSQLRDSPTLVAEALVTLRELHAQGRKIPIAALNLIIESYVHQNNLPEALKVYKQIHTFVPIAEGAKKSFANIETFNLMLKGCRIATEGPDAQQASFLVSELLALRVKPTSLTYDRLILVFVMAAKHLAGQRPTASDAEANRTRALELLDWAYRHFADMRPLGWLPRFGTLETLAVELARVGDGRCWDILQATEDSKEEYTGWRVRGDWARGKVESAWAEGQGEREARNQGTAGVVAVEPDRGGAAAATG